MGKPTAIAALRREYVTKGLSEAEANADPTQQLQRWLDVAIEAELLDATAMAVATVSNTGEPSCRVVLLKQLDNRGLVFFTRYSSQKSLDIDNGSKVSLLFHWRELDRQIRIQGTATRTSREESLHYFHSRPRLSQIAARAVSQQTFVADRKTLEEWFSREDADNPGQEIPIPDDWGGYRVEPSEFEFWQGRENRLHDRLLYSKATDESWVIRRLAP